MMRTIEYPRIQEAQKALLRPSERGGDIQRDFLEAARDSSWDFCGKIRDWGLQNGEEPPIPSDKWSEKEFIDPPSSTEKIIADTWKDLTPAEASHTGTWISVHLAMLEKGKIESSYLAAESGRTGRDRISDVLKGNNPDKDKVDRCVRLILRRLGGVLQRGRRTVYENCPVARAWWRHRYASETHNIFAHSIGDLSDLLRKKPIWNALIPAMTSSLTLIGDSSIRPSLISFLGFEAKASDDLSKKEVEYLIRLIGRRAEIQALGSLSPQQVLDVIHRDIFPLLQKENSA